jgi:pyridoxamine 5'-phosphate oxidase-like protein
MTVPKAGRPFMPAYGIPSEDMTGTLPWSFAEERLTSSHDYWLTTIWPDGRPHLMAVWGLWFDDSLWFSTAAGSRKARNLALEPRCSMATNDPLEPVVVDGIARLVPERKDVVRFAEKLGLKYGPVFPADSYVGGTYRLIPTSIFALKESEFATSPTRWTF